MKRRTRAVIGIVLLAIVACSRTPRLDLATDERFASSLAEVNASLSPQEQARFTAALSVVVRNALGSGIREAAGKPDARAKLEAALSGKSAAEVIAAADELTRAGKATE